MPIAISREVTIILVSLARLSLVVIAAYRGKSNEGILCSLLHIKIIASAVSMNKPHFQDW